MNNVGNNNSENSTETEDNTPIPRSAWMWLGVLFLSIICSLVVGLQVISVLISIASPPKPPIPSNAQEFSYRETAYGVDEWRYSLSQSACEVAQFYSEQGAICIFTYDCNNPASISTTSEIARCEKTQPFSQFLMKWQVIVLSGLTSDETQIRLNREVIWSGQIVLTSTPFEEVLTETP
jgi:hypothetical protein